VDNEERWLSKVKAKGKGSLHLRCRGYLIDARVGISRMLVSVREGKIVVLGIGLHNRYEACISCVTLNLRHMSVRDNGKATLKIAESYGSMLKASFRNLDRFHHTQVTIYKEGTRQRCEITTSRHFRLSDSFLTNKRCLSCLSCACGNLTLFRGMMKEAIEYRLRDAIREILCTSFV
jgi:hypothetical protein